MAFCALNNTTVFGLKTAIHRAMMISMNAIYSDYIRQVPLENSGIGEYSEV